MLNPKQLPLLYCIAAQFYIIMMMYPGLVT